MKLYGSSGILYILSWSLCVAWRGKFLVSGFGLCKHCDINNRKQFASTMAALNNCKRKTTRISRLNTKISLVSKNDDEQSSIYSEKWKSKQSTFILSKDVGRSILSRRTRFLRRLFRRKKNKDTFQKMRQLNFSYVFDELTIEAQRGSNSNSTVGIVLIHPIGVGIGRWFYRRLLDALSERHRDGVNSSCRRLVILSPDLLGSGSGCNPITSDDGLELKKLPLLNVSDWTGQLENLMAKTEESTDIDRWCIVTNGGCSPIALQVAQRSVEATASFRKNVTNVILSSVPRLPFFLTASSDPKKVAKSYRTLCGLVGKIFWWYSCRNRGAFIQKFSERNLVADPKNLGDRWRPDCYETAKLYGGKSKYTTFAFLAGTLQDGCAESLHALKDSNVRVDIIKGRDIRKNRARSWFWQKKKSKKNNVVEEVVPPSKTFRDFLVENGNGGRETLIKGRISLAHEDAQGYSNALIKFID